MKKGWIIALALLLIGAAGAYIWYSRLKSNAAAENGPYDNTLKPRIELSRFDITDISDDAITMNMYMLIDNPLPVGFKAHQLDYTVYIANTPVIADSYKKPIEVKSGDSTVVMMPVKMLNKKLVRVLKTLEEKGIDSTTYKVRSSFVLDVPIVGEKTFAATMERRLPTVYIPKIKIDDIDLGKFGLKRMDVAAKVSITNKNKFPINFTDTRYTVMIDGKQIADGYQPEPVVIKAQATTPVVFPVTSKPGKTLSVLPKMLFDKKDTPYLVNFSCKIADKSDNPMFKNSKMMATVRGTLDDLKKLK
ncbi:LEA type 2 family protein [Spirosoma sp. RP8]|uniref:LEA type 2 family protein n=1 Tax=Spirosoma liriopis TaxID=2937440 RepID=A0ABT0HEX1_9BACT|nr:LEA type 2 family protein [Spirosoma liriopis]MCK8490708.1 LEA type 2 family protein [Spirosoma liriopis]